MKTNIIILFLFIFYFNSFTQKTGDTFVTTGTNLYFEQDIYRNYYPLNNLEKIIILEDTIYNFLNYKFIKIKYLVNKDEGYVNISHIMEISDFRKNYKTDLINKYGIKYAKAILNEEIILGMSNEMILKSWGRPTKINEIVYILGTKETWVYGYTYLFFTNDILTSWKTIKF